MALSKNIGKTIGTIEGFGGPAPLIGKLETINNVEDIAKSVVNTALDNIKVVEPKILKNFPTNPTDILGGLEDVTKQIVVNFLRDRLDLIKVVKGGGTTGDPVLDSVIKGVIDAATEEAANQNKKYLFWGLGLAAVFVFWKKIKSMIS